MRSTWSLRGAARAGDGLLHLVRRVLHDLAAGAAASAMASPLAWPTDMAVRTLTWKNTRSTATTSGRSSAMQRPQLALQLGEALGQRSTAAVVSTPTATACTPAARSHAAVAAAGQPGIDAEHEHAFDVSRWPGNRRGWTASRADHHRMPMATGDRPPPGAAAPTVAPDGRRQTIELDHVHRSFGDNPALAGLTLRVPGGQITVLLGPNGAGKTTAIRMITGALNPDAGTVRVFGHDPNVDGEEVRRRCGVVSAKPSLYDRLSGYDNLAYSAELYGLGRGERGDASCRGAARFGIDHALDQQAGGYSTGMKTRLALARSVLHGPDLLLFDEPTSGLDPESSHAVLDLIREMTATGATVVMCTHLLLEAEGLADQVVVLEDGRDLVDGTPASSPSATGPAPSCASTPRTPPRSTAWRQPRACCATTAPTDRHRVQLDDMARVPTSCSRWPATACASRASSRTRRRSRTCTSPCAAGHGRHAVGGVPCRAPDAARGCEEGDQRQPRRSPLPRSVRGLDGR